MKHYIYSSFILLLTFSFISCWDDPVNSEEEPIEQQKQSIINAVKDSKGTQFILKTDSTAIAGIAFPLFIKISDFYDIDSIGAYYIATDKSISKRISIPYNSIIDTVTNIGNITFEQAGLVPVYYFVLYKDSIKETIFDVINFYVNGSAPSILANGSSDSIFSVKELDTLTINFKAEPAYLNSKPYFTFIDSLPEGASFDSIIGLFKYVPNYLVTSKDSNTSLNPITISASDNSTPPVLCSMNIYITVIDSPINSSGPVISQLTGKLDNERITVPTDTMTFEITDSDGIDTIYYNLNNEFQAPLTKIATNTYQLILKLMEFGSNQIEIIVKDASLLENQSIKVINLNYNTIPSSISNISPANGTIGVDHSNGVTLGWSGGNDIDGDSITYIIGYGTDLNTFTILNTTMKNTSIPNLNSNTIYNWYVKVATTFDTIKYPSEINTYYTFKTKDEGAPSIIQKTGPIEGEYVLTSSNELIFDIKDDNGLDSVYYQLNGDEKISAVNTLNDEYKIIVNLSSYGSNEIILTAVDGSTENNKSTKTINIIYYSTPSEVSPIYPTNNAIEVENIGGTTFKWTKSHDDDGDSIIYEMFYGENISTLTSKITTDTSCIVNNLSGDQEYSWYVNVITEHDTVRCPSGTASYWSFSTINHPSVITGFSDKSCTINDTVSFAVTATDEEGIAEYQWDYNGDNIVDEVTSIGSIKIKANSSAGIQKIILGIKDNNNKIIKDSVNITISNESPLISNLSDTIEVFYGELVDLGNSVNDDGDITSYQWDFGDGYIDVTLGDTSFNIINVLIPSFLSFKFRVTDEDNNTTIKDILIKVAVNSTIISNISNLNTSIFISEDNKWNRVNSSYKMTSTNLSDWDSTQITGEAIDGNLVSKYYSNTILSFNIGHAYLVDNSGSRCSANLPSIVGPWGANMMNGIYFSSCKDGIRAFFLGGATGVGGYNDSAFVETGTGSYSFVSKMYIPSLNYKLPVYQETDSIFVLYDRNDKKMKKFVIDAYNSTLINIWDKDYSLSTTNEAIAKNGDDIYICAEGEIYLSKDEGTSFTKIINSTDLFTRSEKAFINNNELIIFDSNNIIQIDISKY